MSEYLSGEELWDKFDAAWRKAYGVTDGQRFSDLIQPTNRAWNLLAAELKIPRPKVPTLVETWSEWVDEDTAEPNEEWLEILRQRLNAAHEAKERKS